MIKNDICRCGHLYKKHTSYRGNRRILNSGTCWECSIQIKDHYFKLDNLKYLEKKYDNR